MFDNFSKVCVSVENLAVRIMHVDPDRLLFMFDERILIFLKSDSFYLQSVKTPKMAANPLKKTEMRRYTTEVPAFRPFFQRYGWTLCSWAEPVGRGYVPCIGYQAIAKCGASSESRTINLLDTKSYTLPLTYHAPQRVK